MECFFESLVHLALDALDARSLQLFARVSRGSRASVASSASRIAQDRDCDDEEAGAVDAQDGGSVSALKALRRGERALLRERMRKLEWAAGPTLPGDRASDASSPRWPWRYQKLGCDSNCFVMRGGGEMNFTGLYRRIGECVKPQRISFEYKIEKTVGRRGFANVFFSNELKRARRFFSMGEEDVFSVLLPLNAEDLPQLWLPNRGQPFMMMPASADGWHSVEVLLDWSSTELHVATRHDGALSRAVRLAPHDGFQYAYLFNWVAEDEQTDSNRIDPPECRLRNLILEDFKLDDPPPNDFTALVEEAKDMALRLAHFDVEWDDDADTEWDDEDDGYDEYWNHV